MKALSFRPRKSQWLSLITCVALIGTNAVLLAHAASTASTTQATFAEFTVPTLNAVPWGITPGPDGAIWFTEAGVNSNKIGRMTLHGTFSEFALPTASAGAENIASAPCDGQGALWFTERARGQIGRITTAGAIHEFRGGFEPTGITIGPDNHLWYLDSFGDTISSLNYALGETVGGPVPSVSGDPAPEEITAGSDGALWFTELTDRQIVRSDLYGHFTVFPLPNPFQPFSIAAGANGTLWFTDTGHNAIGRLDPTSGSAIEYPVPTANSGVDYLASFGDGTLAFSEGNASKIGRIDMQGTITEYPIPTPNAFPAGITNGGPGVVWFTESNTGKIARLTIPVTGTTQQQDPHPMCPGGKFREFQQTLPDPFKRDFRRITLGPDGALWITDNISNPSDPAPIPTGEIVRTTKNGSFTEFPLPKGDVPSHITVGPDGALWFTVNDFRFKGSPQDKIGRLTTGGQLTEFPVPCSSAAEVDCTLSGITSGPDGNLWFTGGNGFGRITTSGVLTFFSGAGGSNIIAGPDGNLWYIDPTNHGIVRVTPAGSSQEYAFPVFAPGRLNIYSGITAGPGGKIWLSGNLAIASLDPATLQVRVYPSPYVFNTSELVDAGDGTLAIIGSNSIARLDPATGISTEYPTPTIGSGAFGLVAGEEREVWFTENNVDQIGHLMLPDEVIGVPPPPPTPTPTPLPSAMMSLNPSSMQFSSCNTPINFTFDLINSGGVSAVKWAASTNTPNAYTITPNAGQLLGIPAQVTITVQGVSAASQITMSWQDANGNTGKLVFTMTCG